MTTKHDQVDQLVQLLRALPDAQLRRVLQQAQERKRLPRVDVPLPAVLNDEQRINVRQVVALTHIGRTKLFEMIKQGTFPEPERGGPALLWRAGTVMTWMAQRARQSPSRGGLT